MSRSEHWIVELALGFGFLIGSSSVFLSALSLLDKTPITFLWFVCGEGILMTTFYGAHLVFKRLTP